MKMNFALVALALAPTLPAQAADSLLEAITAGKASLDTRLRLESVNDDSTVESAGLALSNRLVLGYKTADFSGMTAAIEFENVSALSDDDKYNSGTQGAGNGNVSHPLIADPYLSQVNQAWIDFKGLKYGRQKVVFDNARFVGDVGWRQNDQTFDGLSYGNKTLVPMTQFTLAWLSKAHNIFGASRSISAPMLNVRFSPNAGNGVTGFYYAVEEDAAPAASWKHAGLRADGTLAAFVYDLSWATQGSYKDGATPDADYMDVQLGYKFSLLTIKAQYEVMDKGFKTPLATLHAFNGWADRFVGAPAEGLEDMNIKMMAPLWGNTFSVAYHQFSAQNTDQDYGQELDLSVARKFGDKLTGMVKYAGYMAEDDAAGALGKDVNKLWLQIQYKFL